MVTSAIVHCSDRLFCPHIQDWKPRVRRVRTLQDRTDVIKVNDEPGGDDLLLEVIKQEPFDQEAKYTPDDSQSQLDGAPPRGRFDGSTSSLSSQSSAELVDNNNTREVWFICMHALCSKCTCDVKQFGHGSFLHI